jgi:hypothetical protein
MKNITTDQLVIWVITLCFAFTVGKYWGSILVA